MDCIGEYIKILETANKLLDYAMDRDYYPPLPPYARYFKSGKSGEMLNLPYSDRI